MAIHHQRAALLLPLFVLLLVSKVYADDRPAVVGDVLAQGLTSNSDSKWAVNVDEGRVQLGRKLVVQLDGDDTNDYAPTGPSHKHDPHFPPSA